MGPRAGLAGQLRCSAASSSQGPAAPRTELPGASAAGSSCLACAAQALLSWGSSSAYTSPLSIPAAWCGDLPLPPPPACHSRASSRVVSVSRGCLRLPPHGPGCCVGSGSSPLQLPDPCVSKGYSHPCPASGCRAVWVTLPLSPVADVLPDPAAHLLLPPASLPQERGVPLGAVQVTGHGLGARGLQEAEGRLLSAALHPTSPGPLPRSSTATPALLPRGPQEETAEGSPSL